MSCFPPWHFKISYFSIATSTKLCYFTKTFSNCVVFPNVLLNYANFKKKSMKSCLKRFCSASSQKVSESKTRIYFSKNVWMRVRQYIYSVFELQRMNDLNTREQHVRLTSFLLRRFSKVTIKWQGGYLSMIWSSGMMFVNLRRTGVWNLQS